MLCLIYSRIAVRKAIEQAFQSVHGCAYAVQLGTLQSIVVKLGSLTFMVYGLIYSMLRPVALGCTYCSLVAEVFWD